MEQKKQLPIQSTPRKSTGSWTQALVTFIFIVIPSLLMWVFLSTDFSSKHLLTTGQLWAAAIGFICYTILISIILIVIHVIWIDTLNFTIPIAIVLMSILLTQEMHTWARGLIAISLIFTAVPANMITTRMIENSIIKRK